MIEVLEVRSSENIGTNLNNANAMQENIRGKYPTFTSIYGTVLRTCLTSSFFTEQLTFRYFSVYASIGSFVSSVKEESFFLPLFVYASGIPVSYILFSSSCHSNQPPSKRVVLVNPAKSA